LTLCVFWGVKGGSGVSVTAAAAALEAAAHERTLLVDLAGDQPAVLGIEEPTGQGVLDWCAADAVTDDALTRLEVRVGDGLDLLPSGRRTSSPPDRLNDLWATLGNDPRNVVVDAGVCADTTVVPSGRSLLVIRSCYLALRRASRLTVRPDGVVVVLDPGRALDRRDVGDVVGAPVVATLEVDPAVARAVDAGTFARRMPPRLHAAVRRLW
jgi:MinD-like ATPase involved in chromosome partitioning or flagellar assembly